MDLNKHIVSNNISKLFHNSGFAEIANGNHFGASSNTSFDQRLQINNNRKVIDSYQRSTLGNARGVSILKPARRAISQINMPQRASLQQRNSFSSIPRRFKEPPTRAYNPYS